MTDDELSATVDRLVADWRAARAEERRLRGLKRIGKIRRAQIDAARQSEDRILRKIEAVARKVGMTVDARGSMPILVEAR